MVAVFAALLRRFTPVGRADPAAKRRIIEELREETPS
jgi:hypothetical protein